MKKLLDEEIQASLDKGEVISDPNDEVRLYQNLYNSLEKGPKTSLPMAFSSQVLRKIKTAQHRRADFRLNLVIGALAALGIVGAYFGLALLDQGAAKDLLQLLVRYKGVWLLVIFTTVLFYWGDLRILFKSRAN